MFPSIRKHRQEGRKETNAKKRKLKELFESLTLGNLKLLQEFEVQTTIPEVSKFLVANFITARQYKTLIQTLWSNG